MPYIAYFAISYGSFVLLLNLNGIIMSVLISSPKTHAFPFKIDVGITGGGGVKDGGAGVIGDDLELVVVAVVEEPPVVLRLWSSLLLSANTPVDQLPFLQWRMQPLWQEMKDIP
jgi:hypothetical protein